MIIPRVLCIHGYVFDGEASDADTIIGQRVDSSMRPLRRTLSANGCVFLTEAENRAPLWIGTSRAIH